MVELSNRKGADFICHPSADFLLSPGFTRMAIPALS